MLKHVGKYIRSLRFRLIVIIILIVAFSGLILRMGILGAYEKRAVSLRESTVLGQAKVLASQIATSDYMEYPSSRTVDAQMNLLTSIYDGRVMVVNRAFEIINDTYNLDVGKIILSPEVFRSFQGEAITKYDEENRYIEMTVPVVRPDDESKTVRGVMVVSVSTDAIEMNLDYLKIIASIILSILAAASVFIGILVSGWLVNPLKKISTSIESLRTGEAGEGIRVSNYTETAEISESFNAIWNRMKVMDDSRQEFVANVSHELKTPLTSMKVLADSLNSMTDAPVELYQEFMEDITNEIERETKIINDLLSLVKMDKAASDLNIAKVNVNGLLEQIMKRIQPIADAQKVDLVLESFRPVMAEIDEVKMSLAFSNLIENAVKYNQPDEAGWVHVTLNSDHQYFYLRVEDNGIGIPEESLEHIYERFYRVDKSHSREIGGTGLGLAITRNAILMHRGAIKVHSTIGEGTTFDVRVPLSYIK